MRGSMAFRMAVGFALAPCLQTFSAEYHVDPAGTSSGDGSSERPWDLTTALAHPESVKPGDTLWLRGGVYRGSFESTLTGTAELPIVVRQAPGERATISLEVVPRLGAVLSLKGEYTHYEGFEVTNENPKRRTETGGSWPPDLVRGSVDIRGNHIRAVNLIIHDLGTGVGFWNEGEGGELYGCLIYNNGWSGPDRGHGHAIYSQNSRGTKRIVDCILFQQFGHGLQVYGSAKTSLKNYYIAGNIAFNNGILHRSDQFSRNLHVGGESPLEEIVIEKNYTWNSALQVGYPWGPANGSVLVRDNYLHGQTSIYFPGKTEFRGNTFVSEDIPILIQVGEGNTEELEFSGNTYFCKSARQNLATILSASGNLGKTTKAWKEAGHDRDGAIVEGKPTEAEVFVRANQYEQGRGHIAIYNWGGAERVPVDLSEVLDKGQRFRIHNARDPFGKAIHDGIYDGSAIEIPVQPGIRAHPVGMPDHPLIEPEPDFGAYLVLPVYDPLPSAN